MSLVFYKKGDQILFCMSIFILTLFLHLFTMTKDPGFLQKPIGVTFLQLLENFDPILLCPDCEVVRTDRSRHC